MSAFTCGRAVMCMAVAFTVSACSAGPGASTPAVPAAAADSVTQALDTAPDAGTSVRALFKRFSYHVDAAKAPSWIMGFVAAGEAQGGVPCISCVNGASTGDNIGLTGPGNYVPTGATWQYSIAYTNVALKGKCTLAWAIMSGNKKVDAFSAKVTLTQEGGFVLYALNRGRPKYSGTATLTGRVTCGKISQTAQAPMFFQ